jgi:hypothetical protein
LEEEILLNTLVSVTSWGYGALHEHTCVDFSIGNDLLLTATTGVDASATSLSTKFVLTKGNDNVVVAKCLLSYRDGTLDSSMGPTIEMIEVHEQYRGQKLLLVLWHWVKCFIEENFTLECLNNDTNPGNIMIKVTQLRNNEIERIDGESLTDKAFFYDYAGFSVRLKGAGALMSAGRPQDEEAVCFTPLLSRQELQGRMERPPPPIQEWFKNRGATACEACDAIAKGQLHCTGCKQVYYCNRRCQKKNWTHHKQWCGKTKDELHALLVQKGLLVQNSDGSWSSFHGYGL